MKPRFSQRGRPERQLANLLRPWGKTRGIVPGRAVGAQCSGARAGVISVNSHRKSFLGVSQQEGLKNCVGQAPALGWGMARSSACQL